MLCDVDSFDHVGSQVSGWAGTVLASAMPRVKGLGAHSKCVEPVSRFDHRVGVDRAARVFACEAKARVASELASAVADASGVAGFALVVRLVVRLVDDGARDLGVVGP